jgi:hypothetical protein
MSYLVLFDSNNRLNQNGVASMIVKDQPSTLPLPDGIVKWSLFPGLERMDKIGLLLSKCQSKDEENTSQRPVLVSSLISL